jgi:hypothetical protein
VTAHRARLCQTRAKKVRAKSALGLSFFPGGKPGSLRSRKRSYECEFVYAIVLVYMQSDCLNRGLRRLLVRSQPGSRAFPQAKKVSDGTLLRRSLKNHSCHIYPKLVTSSTSREHSPGRDPRKTHAISPTLLCVPD